MEIIVKEFNSENHIYLFDSVMRPLSMEICSKDQTKDRIKNLINKNNITDIRVLDQIDMSKSDNYIIDRIL
jgi:hypothetical protein